MAQPTKTAQQSEQFVAQPMRSAHTRCLSQLPKSYLKIEQKRRRESNRQVVEEVEVVEVVEKVEDKQHQPISFWQTAINTEELPYTHTHNSINQSTQSTLKSAQRLSGSPASAASVTICSIDALSSGHPLVRSPIGSHLPRPSIGCETLAHQKGHYIIVYIDIDMSNFISLCLHAQTLARPHSLHIISSHLHIEAFGVKFIANKIIVILYLILIVVVLHGPSGPYPTSEFEHSSIPATVKKIFNLKEFLTKRDAWAGTFDCVLNRTSPRTDCPGKF
ncbi:hypothetical protein RD792_004358 [Penstemon davidsonii]|uniref:Uncharacterized protein n=1 Tax=Penstemon davidsonii TaxID=160366 RepID=A0ABR0DH67_9LAMI|nr:hypothetical protein RD792_004358 [Penstemon davidsonii]